MLQWKIKKREVTVITRINLKETKKERVKLSLILYFKEKQRKKIKLIFFESFYSIRLLGLFSVEFQSSQKTPHSITVVLEYSLVQPRIRPWCSGVHPRTNGHTPQMLYSLKLRHKATKTSCAPTYLAIEIMENHLVPNFVGVSSPIQVTSSFFFALTLSSHVSFSALFSLFFSPKGRDLYMALFMPLNFGDEQC